MTVNGTYIFHKTLSIIFSALLIIEMQVHLKELIKSGYPGWEMLIKFLIVKKGLHT